MSKDKRKRVRHVQGEGAPLTQPVPAGDKVAQDKWKVRQKAGYFTRVVQDPKGGYLAWCSCEWEENRATRRAAFGVARAHYRSAHVVK